MVVSGSARSVPRVTHVFLCLVICSAAASFDSLPGRRCAASPEEPPTAGAASGSPPSPNLVGRATWGGSGALRVVSDYRSLSPQTVRVELINEGEESLALGNNDEWVLQQEDGSRVLASPDSARTAASGTLPAVLRPHAARSLWLVPSRPLSGNLAAVVFRSRELPREVVIDRPYRRPSPNLAVDPVFPARALARRAEGKVQLSVLVGAEGQVSQVYLLSPPEAEDEFAFRAAALSAVRQWRFEPAVTNGVRESALYPRTIVFGSQVLYRLRSAHPAEETRKRVLAAFASRSREVTPVEALDSLVVWPRRTAPGGRKRDAAGVIQFGMDEDGTSWIDVDSLSQRRVLDSLDSRCWEWTEDPDAANELVRALRSAIDARESDTVPLAPQTGFPRAPGRTTALPEGGMESDGSETIRHLYRSHGQRPLEDPPGDTATPSPGGSPRVDVPSAAVVQPPDLEPPRPRRWDTTIASPTLVARVEPIYPESARRARVQGTVFLEAVIEADGAITEIATLRSPSPLLTEAAMQAVCQWRYHPAQADGKPLPIYFTIIVEFKLRRPAGA